MTIGLFIPVYNGYNDLKKLLPVITKSKIISKIIAIDSSSTDKSVQLLSEYGIEVITIDKHEFNHGMTRERGRQLLNTDIIIFMTQDALPNDDSVFEHLLEPIISGAASVAYARQVPNEGADILESFPREFNYSDLSHVRSIEEIKKYGVYTFFCSDSCAAYLNTALDEIGGVPAVLTHEDYFVVARLLLNGHKIAYVSDAVVQHSHNYSALEEFQRYYDAGFVRAQNPWVKTIVGDADERGKKLFLGLLKTVLKNDIILLPKLMTSTLAKYLGYKLGIHGLSLPRSLQKLFSSQKLYWESKFYSPIPNEK